VGGKAMSKLELQKQLYWFWETLMGRFSVKEKHLEEPREKDFFELVEEARIDYQVAVSQFNHVTDHDLVDHAIHNMQAAERKYTYLLKKARIEGYRLPGTLDALRERRYSRADI
jgi:hypothetical protein